MSKVYIIIKCIEIVFWGQPCHLAISFALFTIRPLVARFELTQRP